MTETEWLNSADPLPMLRYLGIRGSERRRRLFACACFRRFGWWAKRGLGSWRLEERIVEMAALLDQLADGTPVERPDWPEATIMQDEWRGAWAAWRGDASATAEALHQWVHCHSDTSEFQNRGGGEPEVRMEKAAQAAILRDIFGNPFRIASLAPAWLTATVVSIAEGIYEGGAFDRMPILADALLDADCDDETILAHCRGEQPHVGGCWVIDGILGKN